MTANQDRHCARLSEVSAIAADLVQHHTAGTKLTPKMREDACFRLGFQPRLWLEKPQKMLIGSMFRLHWSGPPKKIDGHEYLEDNDQRTACLGLLFEEFKKAMRKADWAKATLAALECKEHLDAIIRNLELYHAR